MEFKIKKIGCSDLDKFGIVFEKDEIEKHGIMINDKIEVGLDLIQEIK
jgi:hypothetical protein